MDFHCQLRIVGLFPGEFLLLSLFCLFSQFIHGHCLGKSFVLQLHFNRGRLLSAGWANEWQKEKLHLPRWFIVCCRIRYGNTLANIYDNQRIMMITFVIISLLMVNNC